MLSTQEIFGFGLTRAQKIKKSFWGGLGSGMTFAASGVAMVGFQAANAGRGGFAPAIIGQSISTVATIPLAGFASAALCLIPGVGPLAAGVAGAMLADYAEYRFGGALARKVRLFTDMNKRIRHLEMGGSYKGSELAQRQRFLAMQEMNSSMIPARRYLGQEALLLHR